MRDRGSGGVCLVAESLSFLVTVGGKAAMGALATRFGVAVACIGECSQGAGTLFRFGDAFPFSGRKCKRAIGGSQVRKGSGCARVRGAGRKRG